VLRVKSGPRTVHGEKDSTFQSDFYPERGSWESALENDIVIVFAGFVGRVNTFEDLTIDTGLCFVHKHAC